MKKLIALIAINIFSLIVFSQTPGIQWQHSLGGYGSEITDLYFKTDANNFIVVGDSIGTKILIYKLSSSGVLQWQQIIDGNGAEQAIAAVANPDGSFAVT